MCGVDGKTYQNSCFSSCTIAQDPRATNRRHIAYRGRCRRKGVRGAGPKKNPQKPQKQINNNTAAVAGPAHDPEAIKETTLRQDKPTKPKNEVQQSDGKPDAIETTFRLADSNKDGVQDLAEFRGLEDVEDVVRKLFQHYDQVWLRQQYVSAKIQIYRMETRKCHSRNIE